MPPCLADRYNLGRKIRQGWVLQKTVHVNHQINVSIEENFQYFQNANVVKMVGYKRVAPSDHSSNAFQVT